MKKIYAIGDIHGEYELFLEALENYDPRTMQLLLIGDVMDRGKESKRCFLKAKALVEKDKAIYLRGNHEDILAHFLKDPQNRLDNYLLNGGKETIESFLHKGALDEYSPIELASIWENYYPDLFPFLMARPFYYEYGDFIFVHAGVDFSQKDWKKTSPHDFMWIRTPFIEGRNNTGKTIVFGHTPTPQLYGDFITTDLFKEDHKIGIDGGAVYGGALHGVLFNSHEILRDDKFLKTAH